MPEISEEELKRYQDAVASKKRVEDENAKLKARAQDAETKLSDAEKKKLEEDGETQKLLVKEREENDKLKARIKDTTSKSLKEKLRTEVAKFAKDAHDIDMVLKVSEHKSLLKLDEENITVEGAEEFVKKVRETHAFLFGTKRLPDYDNTRPKNDDGTPADLDDKEAAYRAELKTANSREDIAKVKKKYGKEVDTYLMM